MYFSNDDLPLMLRLCPAETLPIVVEDAMSSLTLWERFTMGENLARAVGLRAEALLSGLEVHVLDALLDIEDVTEAADIVRPYLTA